jgi:hypothetical protein
MRSYYFFMTFSILSAVFSLSAQTGGTYDLSHNVIAGGGGSQSSGGTFTVDATGGQNLAGTISSGGGHSLRGGFWAFQALFPTAASVSISGRIRTSGGTGIKNVRLILSNPTTGETFLAISSPFGYYRFDDLPAGQTYILSVSSKRFSFGPNTRVITLFDELINEDFTALPLK